jgi:hypothetical protein
LEPCPNHLEEAKSYQKTLFEKGIPYTQLNVQDVQDEYDELKELGVNFSVLPKEIGNFKIAIFDDTCGNMIQLIQLL